MCRARGEAADHLVRQVVAPAAVDEPAILIGPAGLPTAKGDANLDAGGHGRRRTGSAAALPPETPAAFHVVDGERHPIADAWREIGAMSPNVVGRVCNHLAGPYSVGSR